MRPGSFSRLIMVGAINTTEIATRNSQATPCGASNSHPTDKFNLPYFRKSDSAKTGGSMDSKDENIGYIGLTTGNDAAR